MTGHQIIINSMFGETRVAVLEGQRVHRLLVERDQERDILGNIYVGQVKRVLPGMQSAFVEIGLDRTAFLFGRDARDPSEMEEDFEWDDDDSQRNRPNARKIESLIKENQEIIVQVAKEPLGTKGARITMRVSLPGRFVVLVPYVSSIGISKRIQDDAERKRLRDIIVSSGLDEFGFIVRTAAEGVSKAHIQKDAEFLVKIWKVVQQRISKAKAPSVVYENLPLPERTIREYYRDDTQAIVVDDPGKHKELGRFLRHSIPGGTKMLKLYDEVLPVFDAYGIERDLEKAISTRIDLPSGGYLIVEHTEALTSFDVNTGSFVGKRNANETIYRTNLEAVEKIVEQILIRNIGGIIVLDLIDMEFGSHRDKIYNRLNELLKEDKEKTNVLKISELGLIQMTRKRTSDSLEKRLMQRCPTCQGKGRIKSVQTMAFDCLRAIMRNAAQDGKKNLRIIAHPDLIHWFKDEGAEIVKRVRGKLGIKLRLETEAMSAEDWSRPRDFRILTDL